MSSKSKPKRLFKVASHFNVSTASIVDSLSDEGFELDNKPGAKVTPEMYEMLKEVYDIDKVNSKEHQRAKEEYENRRSQIQANRNESVSVEDYLEPLEDDIPLEPQEEDADKDLEPQKEEEVLTDEEEVQVFLCHASEDKGKVTEVYNLLKKEGFNPWLDKKDLLPGQNWELEISKTIRESDFVLIFLSTNSVSKRGFVQKEIKITLDVLDEMPESQVFPIPIRLDNCKIPEQLRSIHYVDYFNSGALKKVINSIKIHSK